MPARRRAVALVCLVTAVVVVAAAWARHRPSLTADDARTFTADALVHAGLDDVVVAERVDATTAPDSVSGRNVPAWRTIATVGRRRVVVWVDRSRAQALQVNDQAGGRGALLTDEQFAALDAYEVDPALDRRTARNAGLSVAGALVAAVAGAHALNGRKR